MGLKSTKEKVKKIVSADLIDVQGEINTQGNYIHFSGSSRTSILTTSFQFTLTIAGVSLSGSKDSIENILEDILKNLCTYELKNQVDLDVKSTISKINGDLLAYTVILNIEDETR